MVTAQGISPVITIHHINESSSTVLDRSSDLTTSTDCLRNSPINAKVLQLTTTPITKDTDTPATIINCKKIKIKGQMNVGMIETHIICFSNNWYHFFALVYLEEQSQLTKIVASFKVPDSKQLDFLEDVWVQFQQQIQVPIHAINIASNFVSIMH